jgi:neutral ceramidase
VNRHSGFETASFFPPITPNPELKEKPMHRFRFHSVWLVFAALIFLAAARFSSAEEAAPADLKAGFAERDITPELGLEQPGNYEKQFHTKFHDSCKVRAAVFDDGKTKVALVGIDAIAIRRPQVAAVRKAVQEQCGIAPDHVMISASHSHSAGPTAMVLPGEFDEAPPLIQTLAYEKSSAANADYLARVEREIIAAVVAADAARAPAKCGAGAGTESAAVFNRRFHMRSGRTATHPGAGNPEIVEPAGPVDPTVGVIGAWDPDGKLIGAIVTFACHATTAPGGTSADYVYYIEKTIRGLWGDQAVIVFLPGAAGDVTQVDNRTPYSIRQFGETNSRLVGGRIGAEALKVLLSLSVGPGSLAPLGAESKVLQFKRRAPRPERVARAMELIKTDVTPANRTDWVFAKETLLLDYLVHKQPLAPTEVQAIQIGPAIFLSCPAEYFCQFGLDIRAGSKFPFTFPVSLANDCVGYVPTEEALSATGGGYETRMTFYSNLEPTAGRQIANTLIGMSGDFQPGPIPTPPPLPASTGSIWSYGDVPPELE